MQRNRIRTGDLLADVMEGRCKTRLHLLQPHSLLCDSAGAPTSPAHLPASSAACSHSSSFVVLWSAVEFWPFSHPVLGSHGSSSSPLWSIITPMTKSHPVFHALRVTTQSPASHSHCIRIYLVTLFHSTSTSGSLARHNPSSLLRFISFHPPFSRSSVCCPP